MLYMKTNQTSSRLDRFVDLLLDKKHPFWKDERQRAVYNEAAAAALMLQTILVVFAGSIGLLIGGKQVIGLATAIVLCGTVGQYLIMAILTRRHVELFPSGWGKQVSPGRKVFSVCLTLLYAGSALFVVSGNGKDWGTSAIAGVIAGIVLGGGIGLVLLYIKRKAAR
jgi:MFS family permease